MNRALPKIIVALTLVLTLLLGVALLIPKTPEQTDPSGSLFTSTSGVTESTGTVPTQPATEVTQPPIVKESTATLCATGDILMHMPVINSGRTETGYDFSSIFKYLSDYVLSSDLAVANLETTLAGLDNGYSYSGYPQFNCPDEIVTSLKNAGFDTLLAANNHSYDTRSFGFNRTAQVIWDNDLSVLGHKENPDDPNYLVFDVNGIRLGLACYTYDTDNSPDKKALNGIPMTAADAALINSFDYSNLDLFYTEITESMAQMEEQGVDAVILFLHWGNEYQLQQNATQSSIAQTLCDLGVDVIIGGHPHVVQPMELLTSTTDDTHKTVCLYSMGNAVSNQRAASMNLNTGHTEDGVLFSVTFAKYSDGTVVLESADVLPTWVNKHIVSGKYEYNILPLDSTIEDWKAQFSLTDSSYSQAVASYERTMAIVGAGLEQVNQYLSQHQSELETSLGIS